MTQPVLPLESQTSPPVLEFGQHLDRQTGAPEHPGDLVIGARADPRVHLIGFEADKSWQRQACRRANAAPRAVLSARRPGKKSELSHGKHAAFDPSLCHRVPYLLDNGREVALHKSKKAEPAIPSPMNSQNVKVVVTRKLPELVETRMRELFDVTFNASDASMSRDQLTAAMRTAAVLVPTVTDRIDKTLLSLAGPQLKLVANYGTGVDNIDLENRAQPYLLVERVKVGVVWLIRRTNLLLPPRPAYSL